MSVSDVGKSALKLAEEVKSMFAVADREGRALTPDERQYAQELLDRAEERTDFEKRMRDTGLFGANGNGDAYSVFTGGGEMAPSDPGRRFIESEGFKSISDPTRRSAKWSTGLIEVSDGPYATKGTILEGVGSPGAGSGGGLIPVPQVAPGVVDTLFQPLRLESLMLGGVASGNTVRYINEGTATSGAAGVAEGGTKPESTLGLSAKDEPVKKIATFLPISDEMLDDAPSVQAYLNQRLGLFVNIEVERQLLRGTSGGNEVQGLLTSRSVPVYTGGTADSNAVQMFKALNSMRGSAFVEPEWIVMHPTDYQICRLLTDSTGQFFGGGRGSASTAFRRVRSARPAR